MPTSRDEYEVPATWTAAEKWQWIEITLQEPGITHVEVVKRGTKHYFIVHC